MHLHDNCPIAVLLAGLVLVAAGAPLHAASRVINLARPGVTAARVALEQPKKAIEEKAELAVVMTGTVDAAWKGGKITKENYKKSIESILSQFQSAKIPVILVTIPNVNEHLVFARNPKEAYGDRTPNVRIAEENDVLKTIAKERDIPLVDFAAACAKYDIDGKDAYVRNPANGGGKDGIRLVPAGFLRLAKMTMAVIGEKNLPCGSIACLGDDLVYGTGSPDAGKEEGMNFPGQLSCFLNGRTPKIGFFSEEFRYGDAWRRFGLYSTLKRNGMTGHATNSMSWVFGNVPEEKIFGELCKYHAVILSLDRGFRQADYEETTLAYRNALRRYLEIGGNVLLVPQNGEYRQDRRPEIFNLMFGPYGIKMLREGITDPANQFSYPGHPFLSVSAPKAPSYLRFFRTGNIVDSPMTKGVKTLFFPEWGCGGMWGTMGLILSREWTPVVFGEKTAKSYVTTAETSKNSLFVREGSLRSAPVLAAWRPYGRGKIAVISCNLMHLSINAHACDWPAVWEKNGDGKTKSDGTLLLMNTFRFLFRDALKNPRIGFYQEPPTTAAKKVKPANFDRVPFPDGSPCVKGLIGVHSAFSDGEGTVSEYAAAARKAGYRFLAFTESLEKLTPEKYAALKKACAAVSDPDFYACPGIEFSEANGLRWAFWGEDVIFPEDHIFNGPRDKVNWWGLYAASCNRRPSALLNYDRLHELGDASNLWWYFRIPVKVCRNGQVLARNLREYLFALNDVRGQGNIVFNGIYSPARLAKEAAACGWNFVYGNVENAKEWLNTKNTFDCGRGYASEGPSISLWQGVNASAAADYEVQQKRQRVRLKFEVSSDAGIRDVKVWDGTEGLFRRFDGRGQKQFSREFAALHDRVHHLVLEVTDLNGKKAVSPEVLIQNPYYAVTRCTDNLNLLGYSTLLMHPPCHQVPVLRDFEDIYSARLDMGKKDTTPIAGIDSGVPFIFKPCADLNISLSTEEGEQPGGSNQLDELNAIRQRYPVNSNEVSILTQDSHRRVHTEKRHRPDRRMTYTYYSFFPLGEDQPIADIRHTTWLMRSRIRPSCRFTRPWLADDDYRGGLMYHRIFLKFKKDVVLKGDMPIHLVSMTSGSDYYSKERGFWDRLVVETPSGIEESSTGTAKAGELKNGGFATVLSTNSTRRILIVPQSVSLSPKFRLAANGTLAVGFGKAGQKFKAGDEVSFFLAVCTCVGTPDTAAYCRKIADRLSDPAAKAAMKRGNQIFTPGFIAFHAENGEVAAELPAFPMICDWPFFIRGVEDNGTAAYYDHAKGVFTFVPVHDRTMYFQMSMEKAASFWGGNLFLSSDRDLKLTPVLYGTADAFLEVHNPTGHEIRAEITSPELAPVYGGKRFSVSVPGGTSCRIPLTPPAK